MAGNPCLSDHDAVHFLNAVASFLWFSARFQQPSLGFKFGGQRLFVGKGRAVFGSEDFVGQVFQGVVDDGEVLLGAEDDADGWVLAGVGPVFAGVVEVEVHLAGVGVGELAELQVDNDQAAELAVEEVQVDGIEFTRQGRAFYQNRLFRRCLKNWRFDRRCLSNLAGFGSDD
jgi:hypothetical protein